MVTVFLGLAYCHHQKVGSPTKTQSEKAVHLESANSYIQRASEIESVGTFDQLRIQLYNLLHEINTLVVTTGLENLHPGRRATLCGRLERLHQSFEESQQHRRQPLVGVYQSQIRRKLERFGWTQNIISLPRT